MNNTKKYSIAGANPIRLCMYFQDPAHCSQLEHGRSNIKMSASGNSAEKLMVNSQTHESSDRARVLLYSQRNIYEPEVWRSTFHEFERLLQQIESIDTLAPRPGKWFDFRRNNAQRVGKYTSMALNPGIPKISLEQDYDVFLAVIEKPSELLNVNTLERWADHCKTSVCWLAELWTQDIPTYRAVMRILSKFDHVFFNVAGSIEAAGRKIDSQCHFLPAGIDTLAFCPYPEMPERSIDVLSIGRRSKITHETLLKMARDKKLFYYYDTQDDLHTYDIGQHRFLMSNLAKRSRYFIVNPGKIDSPEDTGGQVEFGYRYFEGAAAGAVLIGESPNTEEFKKYFFWPDAVIPVPFDSNTIEAVVSEMDQHPDQLKDMSAKNVFHSLKNHDWAHRWERILSTINMEPRPELSARKDQLNRLADEFKRSVFAGDDSNKSLAESMCRSDDPDPAKSLELQMRE